MGLGVYTVAGEPTPKLSVRMIRTVGGAVAAGAAIALIVLLAGLPR